MLKQRIVKLVIAVALLATVVGGTGIVGDAVGLSATSPAQACSSSGAGGGGC